MNPDPLQQPTPVAPAAPTPIVDQPIQPAQPVQPQPVQPSGAPQYAAPNPSAVDPGKTFGIVGFVMVFVGLQLIGLIFSIIGFNKSKKAGFKNTLAKVGIILNSIILAIAIVVIPLFLITIVSYNGISERANASAARSTAAEIIKLSEEYHTNNGSFPTTLASLSAKSNNFDVKAATSKLLTAKPSTPSTIEFYTCTDGNKVGYWNYPTSSVKYEFTSATTAESICTFSSL